MSMNQLQPELLKLLSMGNNKQNSITKRLDDIVRDFGLLNIKKWRNSSNTKKNSLLHEVVEKDLPEVVRHLVETCKFDVNLRRDSDGLTPFQLASKNENSEMSDLLKDLGATEVRTEDVSAWSPDEDKEKAMNIVWVDLEMTSFDNPEILECAVIITDKDLNTLARQNWVVHFKQSELDKLADWHQNTFKDLDEGGNGLFANVVKSKITREQMEEELLNLIKLYCPEKMCPLAGSSIHIDKEVIKLRMPKVHDYLHYRIIDVSSFQAIMRRWAPWIETKIKKQLATSGQETVNHRAMDDIEWSISFMKQFRPFLTKQQDVNNRNNQASNHQESHHQASNHRGSHHQASNHRGSHHQASNHQASNHQFKRSASESTVSGGIELPKFNDNVDPSELYADEKRLLDRLKVERTFDVKRLRLTEKWQHVYDVNPHLREVFMNKGHMEIYEKDFTIDNLLLTTPTKQSNSNNFDPKRYNTTEHWGQRKLLITEIEFLTKYGTDDDCLVVYAGAAPGSHVNFLSLLFPRLEFILIDEKDLSATATDKIELRNENFSDTLAKEYSCLKKKILFICNVRTFRSQGNAQNDAADDMRNQMEWYKLMKPYASLLNFRLPREPGTTKYLKGHRIIEPWASKRGSECRLTVKKDAKMIDYDHNEFENALLQFHYVTRVMYYKHNMDDVDPEGLDHCYDCRAEIFILQEYLTKMRKIKSDIELKKETAQMSSDISKRIVDKKRKPILDVVRTLDVIPKRSAGVSTNM